MYFIIHVTIHGALIINQTHCLLNLILNLVMTLDIIDNLCNWYIGKKKMIKKK